MRIVAITASAVLILAGTPAFAQEPAADQPKPKKICRDEDRPTGSIMAPKRMCYTADQWREIDTRAARNRLPAGPVPPGAALDALVVLVK